MQSEIKQTAFRLKRHQNTKPHLHHDTAARTRLRPAPRCLAGRPPGVKNLQQPGLHEHRRPNPLAASQLRPAADTAIFLYISTIAAHAGLPQPALPATGRPATAHTQAPYPGSPARLGSMQAGIVIATDKNLVMTREATKPVHEINDVMPAPSMA